MIDVDTGLRTRLLDFLVEESAALDERRYTDWLGLLTDDFVYEVPVPQSREDPGMAQHADGIYLAHESKSFLTMRFTRVDSDYAWAERPAAFIRHFVSNLRVLDAGARDGRWTVGTNVLVARSRLPEATSLSSAGRHDVIVETPDGLRLQHRTVYLDSELPNDSQTSVIY
ncbi:aromatic-ring-hydroxylating dioxygenase subunit beta [Blastococcus saxobsidens]|uniref:Aromatic-ring-hydroxylating dioxygenase, small subunit n=1 Tax=Blastococcus saxobsidens (strain DD2) TaxID=1146883 RepID=H6RQK6_BLASD|nr:aromatic-ring-hydroxylating dioxygenase subunit beta [Blastococcus saxobsidens]CCG05374.1 Aromatic-ring-hydroxylating dioxygenase, small subunit [Blastococcus saxobsidens DD2]